MKNKTLGTLLTLCLTAPLLLHAEETVPTEEQATSKGGKVETVDGIRSVTGEADATGHGSVTYYHVPFQEGTFSLSWKAEEEQRFLLVFDGKAFEIDVSQQFLITRDSVRVLGIGIAYYFRTHRTSRYHAPTPTGTHT